MAKRTWEQEKAYRARRAQALCEEMEAAIGTVDRERFRAAYDAAGNYMRVRERRAYYRRFLAVDLATRGGRV